jgi:apolipoprotein N-acyltransferase
VNEGATSWIDAAGIVRARLDGRTPDVLLTNAALLETPRTFFDRAGDLPLAALFLASVGRAIARSRRRREGEPAKSRRA